MAVYESHKDEPWFSLIGSRQKSIEGRLRKDIYSEVKPGDSILVYSPDEKNLLKARILSVSYYPDFETMLKTENLSEILPGIKNIDSGVAVYRKYYSVEDEKKFGVVAIEVELMD